MGGEGDHRVDASLPFVAGVVGVHGGGHRVELRVEFGGVGDREGAGDAGLAGVEPVGPDGDVAVGVGAFTAVAHCVGSKPRDDGVDQGGELGCRHRWAGQDRLGEMGIDDLHVGVGHVVGAFHGDGEASLVDTSAREGVTGQHESVAQDIAGADEATGFGGGNHQCRTEFGGGLVETIGPVLDIGVDPGGGLGRASMQFVCRGGLPVAVLGTALLVVEFAFLVQQACRGEESVSGGGGDRRAVGDDIYQLGGRQFDIGKRCRQGELGLGTFTRDTCALTPELHDTKIRPTTDKNPRPLRRFRNSLQHRLRRFGCGLRQRAHTIDADSRVSVADHLERHERFRHDRPPRRVPCRELA